MESHRSNGSHSFFTSRMISRSCQWCGGTTHLEVHHIKPFHLDPELELVDTPALIRALKEGWIAGAGLDVAYQEPLPPDDYAKQIIDLSKNTG